MSRFSEKAIDEMNRQRELKMDIDYSCVQLLKWIDKKTYISVGNNKWCYFHDWLMINNPTIHTTEELYQLYLNDKK